MEHAPTECVRLSKLVYGAPALALAAGAAVFFSHRAKGETKLCRCGVC